MLRRYAFIFLSTSCLNGQVDTNFKIVWPFDGERQYALLADVPERFLVKQFTYAADALLVREELTTMFGLDDGVWVTRAQLYHGLTLIGYQERFQKVIIEGVPEKDGWRLHLNFSAWWLLAKVRCKGSLLGKERYRHQYRSQVGHRFDAIKHHDSLMMLENILHDEGYLAPDVVDILTYDDAAKTVTVTLALDPGASYTMRAFKVELVDSCCVSHGLPSKMQQALVRELYGHGYDKAAVEQALHQLEYLCSLEGFLQPQMTYDTVCNHEQKTVTVVVRVTLGERRHFSFFGNHFFSACHFHILKHYLIMSELLSSLLGSIHIW